jgi:hypothetical protein
MTDNQSAPNPVALAEKNVVAAAEEFVKASDDLRRASVAAGPAAAAIVDEGPVRKSHLELHRAVT